MPSDVARWATLPLSGVCALALAVAPARAQDPAKVAGEQYKLVSENDNIRVLDVTIAPGAKAAMHSHPDLEVIVLEGGAAKWTFPDGKFRLSGPEMKRGATLSMKAETHSVENVGKTPIHVVLVEFKKPAPEAGKGRSPSLPTPYKQVADDAHARTFELTAAPGGTVPEHTHGDHVIVSLSDATAEVTDKGGKKETMAFKKDTALVGGPVTHSGVNTGKTPLHLIVVESK